MSLAVWLPLNGDLHNQGLSNITITSHGATVNDNGKIGKCYQFGTAASDITLPAAAMTSFTTECSVAFWINILTWNTSYATFFQAGPASAPWTSYIFGFSRNNNASTCCFTISNGSSASNSNYLTPAFDLNKWYHVALIYKTGHCLIYIDGQLHQDYSTSIVPNFSGITTIKLGKCADGRSYQTNCLMNDVRIYDHALSAKEVEEIAKGLVLHYKLDNNGLGGENLLANSKLDGSYTYPTSSYEDWYAPITTSIPDGDIYTLSFEAKSTVSGDKMRTHYYSPNTTTTCVSSQGITKTASDGHMDFTLSTSWTKYWVTYTQTATTAVKHVICPRLVSGQGTGTVSIRNIKLEKGSIATPWSPAKSDALYAALNTEGVIYDSSGYGNNGTIVGSLETTTPSPRYSCATYLECSSPTTNNNTGLTYIQAPLGLTAPMQMSVCWWGHPESGYGGSSGHAAWCTSASSGEPTDYNFTAFHHRDSRFDICLNSASTTSLYLSFNNYTLHEWHHYCVTYDGKIAILYKDGIETNRSTISNTEAPLKTFTKMFIGFSKAGGVWRKTLGSYSDFRVYATALTAKQVADLYHTSMTIDNQGNIHARELVEI